MLPLPLCYCPSIGMSLTVFCLISLHSTAASKVFMNVSIFLGALSALQRKLFMNYCIFLGALSAQQRIRTSKAHLALLPPLPPPPPNAASATHTLISDIHCPTRSTMPAEADKMQAHTKTRPPSPQSNNESMKIPSTKKKRHTLCSIHPGNVTLTKELLYFLRKAPDEGVGTIAKIAQRQIRRAAVCAEKMKTILYDFFSTH